MKKIISFALAVVMVMSLLPMTMVSVFAADTDTTEKNITLGATALQGAQKSNVYYGTYKQSSDGNGGYNVDPIKWRVLSNADGKLFLLADQNLDVFQYNTAYEDVTWETSTMRSWLNGYGSYTSDNFKDTAFSEQELAYILKTVLENADNGDVEGGNNTVDYIFLLSIDEVKNTAYGFPADTNSTNTRVSTNTAYVAAGGELGGNMYGVGEADYWWLRSPGYSSRYAAPVNDTGDVYVGGSDVSSDDKTVRPAFNLNSQKILFTSAAKGGKTTFSANTALTGSDGYKLTMPDTSRNGFSAKILKTANKAFVKYQGATTGANEYITAMIVNANGEVTYYGSLKNITESTDASGIVEIDLSGMNSSDKVYILNEQWNGDYKTDYASALKEATIYAYTEIDADNAGTTTVTYGVSENYTVTIPADITLSANGETDVEVKTSSVVVEYGKALTVSVSSTNYSGGKWYLVDTANGGNKLNYSLKSGDNDVTSGSTVLTVAAGTAGEQKATLKAKLVDKAVHSGTYKDTLTFSVGTSIDAASMTTAQLKAAVTAELAAGKTDIAIVMTSTPEADMFTAIRDALIDTDGVEDGSINLTITGVETIPNNAFYGSNFSMDNTAGDKLKSLTLTDAKTIGKQAFSSCQYLTSLNIPNATTINSEAFFYCSSLTSVDMAKVVTLGSQAFDYCDLRTLVLPEVTTIEGGVFKNNKNLVSCSAPKATDIGYYPWRECEKLETLELTAAGTLTLGNNLFEYTTTEKINLVLNRDKETEVTVNTDGTATWATKNQNNEPMTYTFKSITFVD